MDGKPNRPVRGVGPDKPIGLLVGDAPSSDDSDIGSPLQGMTGQQFDDELLAVRLRRSQLFIINAVACHPVFGGKQEQMMGQAVKCCRPAFLAQIAHLPPDIHTLAMGKWADLAVSGKKRGVAKSRGFVRDNLLPKKKQK